MNEYREDDFFQIKSFFSFSTENIVKLGQCGILSSSVMSKSAFQDVETEYAQDTDQVR